MYLTELAEKAEVSAGYLSELESGHYSATARMIGRLADALGCEVTDLMPAADRKPRRQARGDRSEPATGEKAA